MPAPGRRRRRPQRRQRRGARYRVWARGRGPRVVCSGSQWRSGGSGSGGSGRGGGPGHAGRRRGGGGARGQRRLGGGQRRRRARAALLRVPLRGRQAAAGAGQPHGRGRGGAPHAALCWNHVARQQAECHVPDRGTQYLRTDMQHATAGSSPRHALFRRRPECARATEPKAEIISTSCAGRGEGFLRCARYWRA